MKIYVPELNNYECYVVQSEGVIRAYEEVPRYNSTINYRDYYINSDYIFRDGVQQFGNYSTIPVCLPADNLTNDFYYRTDISDIMIIFIIMAIICVFLPIKILFRFFRRFN